MARLLTCGYETGDVNEAGVTFNQTTLTVVSSTPTPRAGTYCMKVTGTTGAFGTYKTFTFAASKTEIWARFAVFIHPAGTPELTFAIVLDSAGNPQSCIGWDGSTNVLTLRLAGSSSGTLLASSATSMTADAWHCIEWRTQITSTTVGVSEVWLDGTRVINFSGDNTNTANPNVQSLRLGFTVPSSPGAAAYIAHDDIAVNDTSGTINNGQIYDGRVVLLKPNGAGSNTAQTRGGTDSGNNWDQCNELPPSMTDYVYSATAATRDTYALEDLPTGTWAVNCCEVIAFAQNSDAGAGSLGLTLKSGATTNEGSAQALTSTAAYF